jgi:hypothetical protein
MGFSRLSPRYAFSVVAMFDMVFAAGCGNSCFIGFSNNGSSSVIISAGNPPPTCSLSQGMGTMLVSATKSARCEICSDASRVEHLFVAVRGIELRDSSDTSTWLEIAPQLAEKPRQIDLMGSSAPETLVESALVPAGSYDAIRVLFTGASDNLVESLAASDCGKTRSNCIVAGDNHTESLLFTGGSPEVVISSDNLENKTVVVLPGSSLKLQLTLEARPVGSSSITTGWTLRMALVGRAAITR